MEFFDSLGVSIHDWPHYLVSFAKRNHYSILQKEARLQGSGDTCGDYAIFYLMKRLQGCSIVDIFKCFDATNLNKNDEIVRKYIISIKPFIQSASCKKLIKFQQSCKCFKK